MSNHRNIDVTLAPKGFWKRFWVEIVVIFLGIIAINLIFIARAYRTTNTLDPQTAGMLGDFVGGFIGTIFALISIVLLYSTLKNQREENALQNFERTYFELIKMHRDNVAELEIGNSNGRKIFVLLMREFRAILKQVNILADQMGFNYSRLEAIQISYYALFFGVGPNSSRMLKDSLANFDALFIDTLDINLNNKQLKDNVKNELRLGYLPFEGHQSRLGHYYRHLYQTVCYVDKQILYIDRYDYVKTIRAQLTTHEQALLLINSLTPIGRNWWKDELITKYRMVRNLPPAFFDKTSELNHLALFDSNYFEWQEESDVITEVS